MKPSELFGIDPDFVAAPSDYEMGFSEGIKAARDAVISLHSGSWGTDYDGVQIDMADALAAIDALQPRDEGASPA